MDGWVDEWMDRWVGRWVDGWIVLAASEVVSEDRCRIQKENYFKTKRI